MNNEQLENEVHMGERAYKAYHFWVMHYIDTQKTAMFESFLSADIEEYPYIQAMADALSHIESAIKSDIQTGELARKQLKGDEFYQKPMKGE